MTGIKIEKSRHDMIYHEVLALYHALITSGPFILKRAEMKGGQVQALPIDFVADVEIKAAQELQSDIYAFSLWKSVTRHPETYPDLLSNIREQLGKVFEETRLGMDGDYRSLYYRTKVTKEE